LGKLVHVGRVRPGGAKKESEPSLGAAPIPPIPSATTGAGAHFVFGDTMTIENRKAPRKRLEAAAFLYTTDGRPLGECRLQDISTGGARLHHSIGGDVPDELLLSLSRDGRVRRRCRIAWRGQDEMGVRFTASDPAAAPPRLAAAGRS
jgi:hypothetical protein